MRYILFFLRQAAKFLANGFYMLANVVPKNKKIWLFSSWYGKRYADNSRYLYEYARDKGEVHAYWVTRDKQLYQQLKRQRKDVVYAFGPVGMWRQMRAGAAVMSHSLESDFFAPCIGLRTMRVQAWHGVPLKKIGHDDAYAQQGRLNQYIRRWLFPYLRERYDIALATGDMDKSVFPSAFAMPAEDVVVTGYPRNDVFTAAPDRLSVKPQRLLYMPTFRGAPGSDFSLFDPELFDHYKIDSVLERYGAELIIKLHPAQALGRHIKAILEKMQHVRVEEKNVDIYRDADQYDALITDFSSIYFDFLLANKPIYMLPINYDDYVSNDRQLYYAYNTLCPSEPQGKWGDILRYIYTHEYPRERHTQLASRVHWYHSRAAERAYKEVAARIHQWPAKGAEKP